MSGKAVELGPGSWIRMASWNNKPQVGWENTVAGFGTFGPVHRVNTLFNLLEQIDPGTASVETLGTSTGPQG